MAAVAAAAAIAALLTACSGHRDEVKAGGPPTTSTPITDPARRAAGTMVVQVVVSGGFVAPGAMVTSVPTHTVLADGTIIIPAATPAIYPGPAIQPLQAGTATPSQVDGLLGKARSLALLGPAADYGKPLVADAPDTTVTITAGGTTYHQTAHALGIGDEAGPPAAPPGGPARAGGVTQAQADNRKALRTFIAAIDGLAVGTRLWTPTAVAAYVLGPYQPDRDLPQKALAWPLSRLPERAGPRPCTLYEGAEAAGLLTALANANARTPWAIGDAQFAMAFRPVVPGQPGCPS